jgi:hypothetical protein
MARVSLRQIADDEFRHLFLREPGPVFGDFMERLGAEEV